MEHLNYATCIMRSVYGWYLSRSYACSTSLAEFRDHAHFLIYLKLLSIHHEQVEDLFNGELYECIGYLLAFLL